MHSVNKGFYVINIHFLSLLLKKRLNLIIQALC
jgi:hypothetical protein